MSKKPEGAQCRVRPSIQGTDLDFSYHYKKETRILGEKAYSRAGAENIQDESETPELKEGLKKKTQ